MDQKTLKQQFYDTLESNFSNKSLFKSAINLPAIRADLDDVNDWGVELDAMDYWVGITKERIETNQLDKTSSKNNARESGSEPTGKPEESFPGPSEGERLKAAALVPVLSRIVSEDIYVRSIRECFFGGRPLSHSEIRILSTSSAIRILNYGQFREWGIPLLDHKSVIVKHSEAMNTNAELVHSVKLQISTANSERIHQIQSSDFYYIDRTNAINPEGEFSDYSRAPKQICLRGSVMDKLMRVARDVAKRYALHERNALQFLLTGKLNAPKALDWSIVTDESHGWSHSFIRLEIEPWIPASSVMRTYKKLREELVSFAPRELHLRSAALFHFVEKEISANNGERPPWKMLRDSWNKSCNDLRTHWSKSFPEFAARSEQDWSYKQDDGGFDTQEGEKSIRRDYEQAKKSIMIGYQALPIEDIRKTDGCYF